jgi:hypothetical protein
LDFLVGVSAEIAPRWQVLPQGFYPVNADTSKKVEDCSQKPLDGLTQGVKLPVAGITGNLFGAVQADLQRDLNLTPIPATVQASGLAT